MYGLMYVCTYMYVCMNECIYVCMNDCMYVCIHIIIYLCIIMNYSSVVNN